MKPSTPKTELYLSIQLQKAVFRGPALFDEDEFGTRNTRLSAAYSADVQEGFYEALVEVAPRNPTDPYVVRFDPPAISGAGEAASWPNRGYDRCHACFRGRSAGSAALPAWLG